MLTVTVKTVSLSRLGAYNPNTYTIVSEMLDEEPYEETVNLGDGVTCFRFSKNGETIYLLWSNSGPRMINFSSQLSGQVHFTDAHGQTGVQNSTTLQLTEEPLFVEP